jgi:hypothetical protein
MLRVSDIPRSDSGPETDHTGIFKQATTASFPIQLCHNHRTIRRDSSVGIALGYGLNDRDSRVRFPAGARNFSLHHRVQNGSGAHPASYPTGAGDSFPGSKAAGA